MIEPVNSLSPEQMLQKLQELTQGLFYRSESDYPVEVVQYSHSMAQELTSEQVLALIQPLVEEPVEVKDLPAFFRTVTRSADGTSAGDSRAQRFQALEAFLKQQIPNCQVYRVGKREIQAYVLGKLNEQTYAGVKTTIIQVS